MPDGPHGLPAGFTAHAEIKVTPGPGQCPSCQEGTLTLNDYSQAECPACGWRDGQ